ncbi:cation:proton antiporter [Paraburkholderia sp. EG287A]|uniref:cation:proton antiporter n=1 Tax=Paraburkholderia sp. EG287A TaxID=3237012 RepID=UPI0034D341E8
MTKFQVFTALTTLTALMAFANQLLFRLRGSLGMAVAGAGISLAAFAVGRIWPAVTNHTAALFAGIDYSNTVFHGMLCFLLFAGAMHIDLRAIYRWKITVALLATVGVFLSTVIVAFAALLFCKLAGLDIPIPWLLVFGALISPTDPVAVLGLLRELKAPKDLETQIGAESLLNDGTALALFSVFLAMALQNHSVTTWGVLKLFSLQVLGGLTLGVVLGVVGHFLLKLVSDPPTSVVMTLAYALGGYTLGDSLSMSGALVAAAMGLVVGYGRHSSMDEATRAQLTAFWAMFDELLNMLLYMMMGMALLALPLSPAYIAFAVSAIACALVGRVISVMLPMSIVARARPLALGTIQALVWGGVRGGVSLAMALALPLTTYKPYLVTGTWAVVMFSVLVQAPTMGHVLRRYGLIGART